MIDEYSTDGIGWARFSADKIYRYRLGRMLHSSVLAYGGWDKLPRTTPRVVFVMCNPSTADAFKLDPTVSKCCQFAQRWDAHVLEVVNLFAFRSPYPKDLRLASDPIGPGNLDAIIDACTGATRVIAAWGANGAYKDQAVTVCEQLAARKIAVEHLGLTQDGYPKHPLARGDHFVPLHTEPQPLDLVTVQR